MQKKKKGFFFVPLLKTQIQKEKKGFFGFFFWGWGGGGTKNKWVFFWETGLKKPGFFGKKILEKKKIKFPFFWLKKIRFLF